ncbi:hypothetical protein FEM48_Zijuj06G0074300 [Ziziphus jujuba var. spinosa]|uniref:Cytochrome P450 CYP82D47-like n=1 Tax=Ziziphus jujuba var. spinosa TaxID=714518 RepID=A0A978V7Y7_ZIZJJ|nr:hypothetical protein FEM48_Zijuj06G0074300 [Ziziphus jujuba var. spinosa]
MELGVACTIFAFLLFLCFLLWISRKAHTNTNKLPPEATGAWPFIGHLPLLRGPQPAYITLGNIADKDGPLFTIKLGAHRALVVSSLEMAKECLTTNDKVFANRPKSLAAELMGYNFAMFGFSPYGPYWRQIRKIATLELLSNHRLEMLKNVRESEVKASIKEVYDLWKNNKGKSKTVEMRRWFGDVNLNIIFRMVVGKRYVGATTPSEMEESERCRKALRDFFKLGGGFVISDALPFLRWLDLGGHGKAMKQTAKELDDVLERWLKQHKQKRVSRSGEIHDFMDLMLSVLDEAEDHQSPSTYDSDTINKATCLLILANLLHAFEITTPLDEPVDLGETSGLTNMKATPLEILHLILANFSHAFEIASPSDRPVDMSKSPGLTNTKATPLGGPTYNYRVVFTGLGLVTPMQSPIRRISTLAEQES